MEEIENVPYKLPDGWKWVRLGEISSFQMGKTPRRNEKIYWENGIYPWVSIRDMKVKYINETKERVSEQAFRKIFKGKIVPAGTLLMSFKLTIGRTAFLNIEGFHNEAIISIYPKEGFLKDYLYWVLPSINYERYINKAVKGKTLNKGILESLPIPIPFKNGKPDLEKQKEIVERIEEIFQRIEKAEELRKRSLEKTKLIFDSALNKIFENAKEDGWKWVKLGEIVGTEKGKRPKKLLKEKSNGGLPYLTADYFREKIIKAFSDQIEKIKVIEPGDLILIWDGSKSGDIFITDTKGILASTMVKLIIKDNKLHSKYMYYMIKQYFPVLNKNTTGSGIPHVSKDVFMNLSIPIPFKNGKPDLEKQREIAEYLDNLNNKVKQLEKLQTMEMEKFNKLKNSVLNKAFRGELV